MATERPTHMDEAWQQQQEEERRWQEELAQDPAYAVWLDRLEQQRKDLSADLAQRDLDAGKNPI